MRKIESLTLLDGITGTDDGVWIDACEFISKSIHIKGITTATLHICGSCEPGTPANTDHGIQIGDDVSADCLVEIPANLRFVKVRCSAYTGGTIYAYLAGVRER